MELKSKSRNKNSIIESEGKAENVCLTRTAHSWQWGELRRQDRKLQDQIEGWSRGKRKRHEGRRTCHRSPRREGRGADAKSTPALSAPGRPSDSRAPRTTGKSAASSEKQGAGGRPGVGRRLSSGAGPSSWRRETEVTAGREGGVETLLGTAASKMLIPRSRSLGSPGSYSA